MFQKKGSKKSKSKRSPNRLHTNKTDVGTRPNPKSLILLGYITTI